MSLSVLTSQLHLSLPSFNKRLCVRTESRLTVLFPMDCCCCSRALDREIHEFWHTPTELFSSTCCREGFKCIQQGTRAARIPLEHNRPRSWYINSPNYIIQVWQRKSETTWRVSPEHRDANSFSFFTLGVAGSKYVLVVNSAPQRGGGGQGALA